MVTFAEKQPEGAKAHPLFCATYSPRPTHWVGSPAVPFYKALGSFWFFSGCQGKSLLESVDKLSALKERDFNGSGRGSMDTKIQGCFPRG